MLKSYVGQESLKKIAPCNKLEREEREGKKAKRKRVSLNSA